MKTMKEFLKTFDFLNATTFKELNLQEKDPNCKYQSAFIDGEQSYFWFTYVPIATPRLLEEYFFKRSNPVIAGTNFYRPFFLIVSDFSGLYMAGLEDEKFTKYPNDKVMEVLVRGLADSVDAKLDISQPQKELMDRIKREINERFGPSNAGNNESGYLALNKTLKDNIHRKDRTREAHLQIHLTQEKIIKEQSEVISEMNDLVHHILFSLANRKQLMSLLELPGTHIYINPWYNGNLLLAKASNCYLSEAKNSMQKWNDIYLLIAKDGSTTIEKLSEKNPAETMMPGWFRLDREKVKWFMDSFSDEV